MEEKYLAINAGSSSLKFSLSFMPSGQEIVNGVVEKIGQDDAFYTLKFGDRKLVEKHAVSNHTDAVNLMLQELLNNHFISDITEIKGVGHRVVHGGEEFKESVVITEEVLESIKGFTKYAPIHMPGEIAGIESIKEVLPDVPSVAVFDTSFYKTIPEENYIYAVPYSWYEEMGVRKYGFHGTSHKYITEEMSRIYHRDNLNLIICHIGSGASVSCIKKGVCINTTMGMTPLDGLMMGTRSGSVDPAIVEYVCKEKNMTVEEATNALNFESGLQGIAGKSDYRDVERLVKEGDPRARLALTMLEKSIVKYIAEYYFELGGNLDALVFTAGMGENAILLREEIINLISEPMGVSLNKEVNDNIARFKEYQSGRISDQCSDFHVWVIPTNEEYMILRDTFDLAKVLKENNMKRSLNKNNKQ